MAEIIGTALGSAVGCLLGAWLGPALYDLFHRYRGR